jgi:hypothetical protein
MKSPILNWTCGILVVLGLPLGVIVAFSSGSLLAGFVSMITVVLVAMLACCKDIIQEYGKKNTHPPNKGKYFNKIKS